MIQLLRDGEIWQAGPYDELRSAGTAFEDLVTAHEEVMGGMSENHTNSDQNSSTQELQKLPSRSRSRREDSLLAAKENKKARQLTEQEEKELGNSSTKAYLDYLKQDKGFLYLGLSTFFQLIFVLGQVASNWWMASEIGNPATSRTKLIFVYSSTMLSTGMAIIFRSTFGTIVGLRASRSFFTGLMDSLFRAPMAFFDSTPTGRIISRVQNNNLGFIENLVFGHNLRTHSTVGLNHHPAMRCVGNFASFGTPKDDSYDNQRQDM